MLQPQDGICFPIPLRTCMAIPDCKHKKEHPVIARCSVAATIELTNGTLKKLLNNQKQQYSHGEDTAFPQTVA